MSSINNITPQVSLSDVRGQQAADHVKNSTTNKDKIQKSAKDFEAVLMSSWLEQAQKSFATVPGGDPDEDKDPGHDQFQSIATQAVATAMSGHQGGLGIATMVAKHLETANKLHAPIEPLKIKDLTHSPVLAIPLKTPEVAK